MSQIELRIHSIIDANSFNLLRFRFIKCVCRGKDTEPLHGLITLKRQSLYKFLEFFDPGSIGIITFNQQLHKV